MSVPTWALLFAAVFIVACDDEGPRAMNNTVAEPALRVRSERLDRARIDVETAVREMRLELERLEQEWDPSASRAVADLHRTHIDAVRRRIARERDLLASLQHGENRDFARARRRAQVDLDSFESRLDALDIALEHAGLEGDGDVPSSL